MSRSRLSKNTAISKSQRTVRCAIYTRKSTEDGLSQEFNSLDAQRDAAESFIRSQGGEGWVCLPDRFDDGGFTGGNMDRPALTKLLKAIETGQVDCVVVYKVDRLSRSLLDFARMMSVFDAKQVAFVSVTQQFNTANSMGRLVLNVLLSFAQFEREIISERIRDKIAATRRKGKWTGGRPVLGYTVNSDRKLVIVPEEADRVRSIFALYLELGSLLDVIHELGRRGWCNKTWTNKQGRVHPPAPWTKTSLHQLLTNVLYVGRVKYKSEVHPGEHTAIIDPTLWQRVQAQLERNGRTGGREIRNRFGALLKGLVRCRGCQRAMTAAHTTKGTKRYRYYVCTNAQKRGWGQCPHPSVSAPMIENAVVEQITRIGKEPGLAERIIEESQRQDLEHREAHDRERQTLERELKGWYDELKTRAVQIKPGDDAGLARLAELQERIRRAEEAIQNPPSAEPTIDISTARKALERFAPIWQSLNTREQARLIRLLVEMVEFDGETGKLAIRFRPAEFRTLTENKQQGNAA
ncbi:MAG: recombinase family protein [Gemmataceae bacterium]